VKEDPSTQSKESLPEEPSATSRVAGFLTSFIRKKKPTPEKPEKPAGVPSALFLDSKGKIVTAQPRCAALFGQQADELSGLNIKDLIKPGSGQEIANILAKGREAKDLSFRVLALRKDGSEFAAQFTFKFLQDFRFRWTVFVHELAGSSGGTNQPAPQAIVPTTETATTEVPEPASVPPAGPVGNEDVEDLDAARQRLQAQNRNLSEANAKARAELDREREAIKLSRKKEEAFHAQVQTLQGALEQAEARAHDGAPQSKDWEKRAANLKKAVDQLTHRHAAEQNAAIKAAQRIKELEEQLKRAGDDQLKRATDDELKRAEDQATDKKDVKAQGDTRHRLKAENRSLAEANVKARADLDKEREAIKVSQKKEEELLAQVQKLQGALEQAEAGSREGAPQAGDWKKKAADLKKSVDQLTHRHAAEQNAAIKAAQRIKELEEQLKRGGDNKAAGKKPAGDQEDTRHRLKAENRNLIEASERTKAELEKERVANKLSQEKEAELGAQVQKLQGVLEQAERARQSTEQSKDCREADKLPRKQEEELDAQIQKLQGALEQAEARAEESAAQSDEWKEKAAVLKKSVDQLTHKHAAEQMAAVKAGQRVKELEEQLKRPGDNQATGKKNIEGQESARQFLEAENRKLIEAGEKAKAELEKERVANKLSREKEAELGAQVQKLQGALEQAEARARESTGQSTDREASKLSGKKEEELDAQIQKLQGALEQAEARAEENAARYQDWKEKAAEFKKSVDQLTHKHAAEHITAEKSAQRVKELEEQLKLGGSEQAAGKKNIEGQDAALQLLEAENRKLIEAGEKTKAELEKELVANRLSREKEEELRAQVQKLQGALDQAEARARESTAQSKDPEANKPSRKEEKELDAQVQKLQGALEQAEARAEESAAKYDDWKEKAAVLKKSVDQLTHKHAAEQMAAVKAGQRVKELEEQLKRAGDGQAAGKKDIEAQDATRQRLEAENRKLIEASDSAKADLEKEREAIKLSRKKEEELDAQVKKLQSALDQAEARSSESATQSKDWEKKVADLKKSVDDLTRRHAAEQNAAVKAAQRVKELEEQLKRAGDDRAAGKKDVEAQDASRQRLEAENRKLIEASDRTKTDLEKERDAIKLSRKKEEELDAQVRKLQGALEQAETHAREGATQSRDWGKKAADLKKSVEELTNRHAAEQNAAIKATQRVKELEEQLKRAGDDLAAAKKDFESQDAARQRLEAENRNLTEASAKARADLEKERDAAKVFLKKEEELRAQGQKLQGALETAEARARESATQSKDWERKASDLKKSIEELTTNYVSEQSAAAKRVTELEQQLRRASDDLAASKAENRHLTESTEKQAALEKKVDELELRARQNVFSIARANAELESQRAERERAEKNALAAGLQMEELKEKLKRQVELQRASLGRIVELEKTMDDRIDDLARVSVALRDQARERQLAQKQSRLASGMDQGFESKPASYESAKKAFEVALDEVRERVRTVECSLEADSGPEKEIAELCSDENLLVGARQQLEKLSAEIFSRASRMYGDGHYKDCHELMKELMAILNDRISIFDDAWNLHAQTLLKLSRFDEAKAIAQQRIKAVEERLGKKHPSLISPLSNLAAILERTGFVFEAEQATRRVSSIKKMFENDLPVNLKHS
jgi:PAS domain S-box-containing protein